MAECVSKGFFDSRYCCGRWLILGADLVSPGPAPSRSETSTRLRTRSSAERLQSSSWPVRSPRSPACAAGERRSWPTSPPSAYWTALTEAPSA